MRERSGKRKNRKSPMQICTSMLKQNNELVNTKLMNTQKREKLSEDQKETLLGKTTPPNFSHIQLRRGKKVCGSKDLVWD